MAIPTAATQREWARIGAAQRLEELRDEQSTILSAFPELRRGRAAARPAKATGTRKAKKSRYKKKRTISPEARKRMAAGMKKYWAARKAAAKKAAQKKAAKS